MIYCKGILKDGGLVRVAWYFDLHCHLLCGVDDGASSENEMYAMLDMAYADGTRAVCLTPHFSPYLFGDTSESSQAAFEVLRAYAERTYPDLSLFLGHELGYYDGCIGALDRGECRTVAGSRYVLVDFPEDVEFFQIDSAIRRLRGAGYRPILAHTERYRCLAGHMAWVADFHGRGGVVQINAADAVGGWGRAAKSLWKKLVKERLVDIVSSDGHNLTSRQPKLSVCMELLSRYCDAETVRALTWGNAWRVVRDEPLDTMIDNENPESVPAVTSERTRRHGRNQKNGRNERS